MNINRRKFLVTCSVAAAAGVAGVSLRSLAQTKSSDSKTLIVFDGGGAMGLAQRKAYSEPFEIETGIRVIHQPGTNSGIQRAAILAGVPKYDVANISGGAINAFKKDNLLLPIDYGLWNAADRNGYDIVPTDQYHAPAMLYSMLLAFNTQHFSGRKPASWAELWDAAAFPGRRTLASGTNAADGCTYEIALLADGVPPEKLYPIDWERAFSSLDRLKQNLAKWWATGAESMQLLVDGQAALGSGWNGRIDAAAEAGAPIGKSWEQGILQWSTWAIPKGAANVDNAQKYIAYMSRPEAQARFSELISYGPTNSRAFAHLAPEVAVKLPTAPSWKSRQIVQNYDFWNTLDDKGETALARAIAEWERWVTRA
ncbi:polyamine ABC transporter substrate-binding protein [Brenneria tiliae]|uniref:Polyamine ABC transporter substrate-binding protein n=1 Tax=Brenneria tiliae TaxID=2914984 RepID=A0ABT0MP99_9GAMM|nr:polyamine ABC transporter substrate-binding protein [Brenneria tiliae]MCL2891665.1 polyamine ABC transporter substrate-binding protein [Brenneria tiliae]